MLEDRKFPNLVEWVVNAGSLQVGSNLIQKSVVLFRVGQRWVVVVGLNVCQQRPSRITIKNGLN